MPSRRVASRGPPSLRRWFAHGTETGTESALVGDWAKSGAAEAREIVTVKMKVST